MDYQKMNVLDQIDIEAGIPQSEPDRQYYFMKVLSNFVGEFIKKYDRQPKYHVVTYGCQMNAKDSEKLKGILETSGYISVDKEDEADLILYNTCTVRENAN